MGKVLSQRIKQSKFESSAHEAMLNLMVASDHVRRRLDEVCEPFGITHTQYNVLRILRGAYPQGYPRHEIIGRMLEEAPDVTRLITRLEKRGLVTRSESLSDRRLSVAHITRKGLTLLDKMKPAISQLTSLISNRMSQSDQRHFSTLCERLYRD